MQTLTIRLIGVHSCLARNANNRALLEWMRYRGLKSIDRCTSLTTNTYVVEQVRC